MLIGDPNLGFMLPQQAITESNDYVGSYDLLKAVFLDERAISTTFSTGQFPNHALYVTFNKTGTRMFLSGPSSLAFFEYALSEPWNPTTATFLTKTTGLPQAISTNTPDGLDFCADYSRLYCLDHSNQRIGWAGCTAPGTLLNGYTLNDNYATWGKAGNETGLSIGKDGRYFFIGGYLTGSYNLVHQNRCLSNLPAASSSSFISSSSDLRWNTATTTNQVTGLDVSPDYKNYFVSCYPENVVRQYRINNIANLGTTAWGLVDTGKQLDLSGLIPAGSVVRDCKFSTNGGFLFVIYGTYVHASLSNTTIRRYLVV